MVRRVTALLIATLALSVVFSTPAQANSTAGLANPANAWIVSDLQATGYGAVTAAQSSGTVSGSAIAAAKARLAASTTQTFVAADAATAGVTVTSGGGLTFLGQAVNTVGVLGTATFLLPDAWFKGGGGYDGAPEEYLSGNEECGFTNIPGFTMECAGVGLSKLIPSSSYQHGLDVLRKSFVDTYNARCNSFAVPRNTGPYHVTWYTQAQNPSGLVLVCGGPPNENGTGRDLGWVTTPLVNDSGEVTSPASPTMPPLGAGSVQKQSVISRAECRRPDGTSIPLEVNTPVTERNVEIPDVECPTGTWLENGSHELATTADGVTTKQDLGTYEAPDWVGEQASRYPECAPVGALQCQLKLFKQATATQERLDCFSIPVGAQHPCAAWQEDPNKTEDYLCMFGPYTVALAKCDPYGPTFSTDVMTPTDPDVAGEPDPPVAPEWGPEDGLGECKPGKWYHVLNPFWAFKAAGCAIKWAFLPPAGTFEYQFGRVKYAWLNSTVGTWVAGLGGVVEPFTHDYSDGNCAGPSFVVPMPGIDNPVIQPLNACDDPMKQVAAVGKVLLSITITIAGVYKCANTLLAAFGLHYRKPSGV